jgi:hypothetical protein
LSAFSLAYDGYAIRNRPYLELELKCV